MKNMWNHHLDIYTVDDFKKSRGQPPFWMDRKQTRRKSWDDIFTISPGVSIYSTRLWVFVVFFSRNFGNFNELFNSWCGGIGQPLDVFDHLAMIRWRGWRRGERNWPWVDEIFFLGSATTLIHLIMTSEYLLGIYIPYDSCWFQPTWKICSKSNWIISPGTGGKIKHVWVATT